MSVVLGCFGMKMLVVEPWTTFLKTQATVISMRQQQNGSARIDPLMSPLSGQKQQQ